MRGAIEANYFLQDLGINTLPVNPFDICRQLGITYREDPFSGFDGMLAINAATGKSLIAVNAKINSQGRKKFTVAHELGHYCMDIHEKGTFYCAGGDIDSFKKSIPKIELRTNEFAAELLMPCSIYQGLADNHQPDWDNIEKFATLSETSLTSTAKKYIDLTDEACCFIVSKAKQIISFQKSDNFNGYIQDGFLSPDTIAHDIFQGVNPPNYFKEIEAEAWILDKDSNNSCHILEWSLPINSYGQVFTMLFDETGELERNDDNDEEWDPSTFHRSKRK